MSWRLLDRDPDGTEEWFKTDPVSGKWIIRTLDPDVSPVLDASRVEQNDQRQGYSASRDLRHVARIPNIVILKWLQMGVNFFDPNDRSKIRKLLNDPDWRWLKTVPGRV